MSDWERFGESVAQAQDRVLAEARGLERAREKLIASVAAAETRKRRWWPLGLALAGAGAAIALGLIHLRPSPLRVTVGAGGQPAEIGSFISARPGETLPVGFSDGSRLVLAPDSAARVTATAARGARLVLESGRAQLAVIHRSGADWHLRAGPFDVHVTGTRFELGWRPETGQLDLTMQEGRVVVSGGCLARPQEVGTGERLLASSLTQQWEVSSGARTVTQSPEATAPLAGPTAPAPRAALPDGLPAERPNPAGLARPSTDAHWRQAVARGQYREAMALLDENAWSSALRGASASDLMALANAARLADDPGHATAALLGLRRRFPSHGNAKVAAFTLGRLAFDQSHAYAEAATWFERYLQEAPKGELAREAAGRLIEAYRLAGNHAAAQGAARQYLIEYPSGPHADLARQELAQPSRR
jgi:transmembrane sensor